MRIFITGGTGFIGSYVVSELQKQGNTLLVLSRQPEKTSPGDVEIVQGDLASTSEWQGRVKRFQPTLAIHLAWESLPNYDTRTSIINLNHSLRLLSILSEMRCKSVICAGSCWEYGQREGKVSEDMELIPTHNAFTVAKGAVYWMGQEITKEGNMDFIWARLFYVYGPGQREAALIPHIIKCLRQGKEPNIKTPLARNDFIYVEDVARAISSLVKGQANSGAYNIGSGYTTSVREIMELVYNQFNHQLNTTNVPPEDSPMGFWADISKIKRSTNWEPQVGITEGIQEVIRWGEVHPNQHYPVSAPIYHP